MIPRCQFLHNLPCEQVSDRLIELEEENAKLRDKYDIYEQKMDALVWTITCGLLSKSASTPNDVLCSTAEENLTKRLQSENAKLRELCSELLRMAESSDPEWLHWPELHDELRELGVEVG